MKHLLIIIITIICCVFSSYAYTYKMSSTGLENIKSYENCRLTKYKDSKGYSIGWGHLIKKGENYTKISQATADKLFVKDIAWVNDAINRILKPFGNKVKFSQGFIDGLGDLIYNCGEGGVYKTEFYKRLMKCRIKNGKINQNDFNFTVAAIKTSHVYVKGHKSRRYKCHMMMLN